MVGVAWRWTANGIELSLAEVKFMRRVHLNYVILKNNVADIFAGRESEALDS